MATRPGTVPAVGSTEVFMGFILCQVVNDPDSQYTVTFGSGADEVTATGTLDITFN